MQETRTQVKAASIPVYINCLSPVSYDKETVLYEIGYKGTLADGRGQVNASIYRYDYEGYQDQIDTYDTAQNRSVDTVTNAGDAPIRALRLRSIGCSAIT